MRVSTRVRGLPVFGFAVAGLLVGHFVSYVLAVPDPHHRDLVLGQTGHGYLPAAGEAALVLALAGVVALVVRSWSGRGRADAGRLGSLARSLATIQVLAFAGQELLERLVAGAPLGGLVHGHVLVVGVLVQVSVALAGAAVLHWLARTSARLATVTAPRAPLPQPAPAIALALDPDTPRTRIFATATSVRGPPSA